MAAISYGRPDTKSSAMGSAGDPNQPSWSHSARVRQDARGVSCRLWLCSPSGQLTVFAAARMTLVVAVGWVTIGAMTSAARLRRRPVRMVVSQASAPSGRADRAVCVIRLATAAGFET